MKKTLLFLFSMLLLAVSSQAQMYTRFVIPTGGILNAQLPFNSSATGAKVQYIYPPAGSGYFNGSPTGFITKIYFYVPAGASATNATYTNLSIKMAPTSVTTAGTSYITAAMQPCLTAANYVIPMVNANGWIGFDLQNPFYYDNTKGFVVEISHDGLSNGFPIRGDQVVPAGSYKRTYATTSGASAGSVDVHQADFGFDIKLPCDTITGFNASNITYNSMDLTWNTTGEDSVYEYIVSAGANPPAADPAGNYQPFISANKIALKNLLSDSCFYIHIARICKVKNTYDTFSRKWSTFKLCTLPACETPQVTITDVEATTAVATWNPVPTVKGYEFAVSILPTPPVEGEHTIATSLYLQGLTPNKTWFFHLRALCDPTPLSSWSSTPLHTKVTSVEDVNGGDLEITAYPNPVKNELNVMMLGTIDKNATIVISDITGKVVRNISVAGNDTKVDMGSLADGLYILKYSDATRSHILKINKQ